ncbi:MAG: hypothetical protein IPM57_00385 [Oligoflexia bacterium]|nr:hypothetical protein [Oligoflexia bacterium]
MKHVVIMAGGSGTRFWPKSTSLKPKQFLNLFGKRSMIQMTFDRVKSLVTKKNISVVCSPGLSGLVKKHLPGVGLILEPEARNTMAAVCLSAWHCYRKDPEAVVCVLPSDAYISDVSGFQKVLESCFDFSMKNDFICCIGIKPTYAATGYGYIEAGELCSGSGDGKSAVTSTEASSRFYSIKRFVEKPESVKAGEYVASGKYSWNAGIFVFKASTFINEVRTHAPEFFAAFEGEKSNTEVKKSKIKSQLKKIKSATEFKKVFKALPKVAVDVALMEKTKLGAVVPGDFGWNDVGSWPALEEVLPSNSEAGLVLGADSLSVGSSGVIASLDSKKFLALVGVKDLIIVESGDSILVCSKKSAQEIKTVVDSLKNSKNSKRSRLV